MPFTAGWNAATSATSTANRCISLPISGGTRWLSLLRFRPEARPNPGLSASCLTSIWQSVRHVRQGQYHGRSLFAAGFDLTWLTSLTLRGTSLPVSARHFAKSIRNQVQITRGTRLINRDVPQHVVQKILDHDSPQMTAHYARLSDNTVREHWEKARKVGAAVIYSLN